MSAVRALWLAPLLALAACGPIALPEAPASPVPAATSAPAGTVPPYSRAAFGDGWASTGRGCDTRDAVLARDLHPATTRGCDVTGGTLHDPYTGAVVSGSSRLFDIDHLVPLEYAWTHGARAWTPARREAFANDTSALVATTVHENRSKGSQDIGEWVPAVDPCGYSRRFDATADSYGLLDPARDGEVARACR